MVSCLIVNWNGRRYLADCLRSIQQKVTVPYEVIVVDNASTDGSCSLIELEFPWVKLIRSTVNLGFAGGNNLAARHATGDLLLLLNNDTLLGTDLIDAVRVFEADLKIGIVSAGMFNAEGVLQRSTGHFPTPSRLWIFSTLWDISGRPYQSTTGIPLLQCDTVEGSFLMTPAALWNQIGGMDERIFMYVEDTDYCRAVFEQGMVTVKCPSLRYTHFSGYNHARMRLLFMGFRRYHRKFSPRWVQVHADMVLRVGLWLRLPWYWLRALIRKDETSKAALKYALDLNRTWNTTLNEPPRRVVA